MASRTPLSSASASGSTAVSRNGKGNGTSATREVPRSCVDTTNSDSLRSSTVSLTRPVGSGKRTCRAVRLRLHPLLLGDVEVHRVGRDVDQHRRAGRASSRRCRRSSRSARRTTTGVVVVTTSPRSTSTDTYGTVHPITATGAATSTPRRRLRSRATGPREMPPVVGAEEAGLDQLRVPLRLGHGVGRADQDVVRRARARSPTTVPRTASRLVSVVALSTAYAVDATNRVTSSVAVPPARTKRSRPVRGHQPASTSAPSASRIRRAHRSATTGSWVATSSVAPSATTSSSRSTTPPAVPESRLPVGSSARTRVGLADQGPGDRDPLLLAAGQLARERASRGHRARPGPAGPRARSHVSAPGRSGSSGRATFSIAVSPGSRL